MLISYGTRASDAHPQTFDQSWPAIVSWIYNFPRVQCDDKDGPYIVLAAFNAHPPGHVHGKHDGPPCHSAAPHRHLSTLYASYGVPLDFDKGLVTAEIIANTLRGYAYVAYTTASHKTGAERWRVLAPVAAPMDAATHRATWEQLSAAFPGGADVAAKDASRLSYLPGACAFPADARIFHADGALFQPAPVIVPAAVALAPHGDGPVPGWAGPTDDETLLAVACSLRMRPDERFGQPIHFAMLWTANEQWLNDPLRPQFHPTQDDSGKGRSWNATNADMALAGELAFFTGSDRERMARLMRTSGLATIRAGDDDWSERKVYLAVDHAISNAKRWHFMEKPQKVEQLAVTIAYTDPATGTGVTSEGVLVPPSSPTAMEAALANAPMDGLNDYWSYNPDGRFIYRPTGKLTVATTVDNVIGKDARMTLYASRAVHTMAWAPGMDERFQMRDLDKTNTRAAETWCYNQFTPMPPADIAGDVTPWLKLWEHCYPETMQHAIRWMADRRQNPGRKCSHGLVMGSRHHGMGKDTLLLPLQAAVGAANFNVISPDNIFDPFDPWKKSIVLIVEESRDMDAGTRYAFYEKCKILLAAPPLFLQCNEKHLAQQQVQNVLGVIFTTNHEVDALHIPPDDRRHFCMWSDAEPWTTEQFQALYSWLYGPEQGLEKVAHYLDTLDLSDWRRDERPPKTSWWHTLVSAGQPEEDTQFADALEKLSRPDWVTLDMVAAVDTGLAGWLKMPGNRRKIARHMAGAGYAPLLNPNDTSRGRWHLNGGLTTVYARKDTDRKALLHKFGAVP